MATDKYAFLEQSDPVGYRLVNKKPKSYVLGYFEGLFCFWTGLRYMFAQPRLWLYAAVPILINLILTLAVLALIIYGFTGFLTYLHPYFTAEAHPFPFLFDLLGAWVWKIIEVIVAVVISVVLIGIIAGFYIVTSLILNSVFYVKLAQQVEINLGLKKEDIREISVIAEISDAIKILVELCVANLSFLLLNLIPVIGSVAALVISFYYNSLIFGIEYMEYPLALRGAQWEARRAFAKQHRAHTLGLGFLVYFMTFIPVIGSVCLTTAVVGTVFVHRRIADHHQ